MSSIGDGMFYKKQESKKDLEELEKDLDYATKVAAEALLKIGHRGSNQEDRNNDEKYEKIHDIRTKYRMDK
jgi:hypothetical protein